jgi:hypothetical protein
MSLYETQRLIHTLNVDQAQTERFRADAAAVMAEYDLDETERTALAEGDAAALWSMGVHPLLMLHFCCARQIPPPEMYKQIGPLAGQRPLISAHKRQGPVLTQ